MRVADLGHFDRQGLQQQQQDWRALEWAGEEMNGDRELCMAAVTQDVDAFEYAGTLVKNDAIFITAVLEKFRRQYPHNSSEFNRNRLIEEGYPAEVIDKVMAV